MHQLGLNHLFLSVSGAEDFEPHSGSYKWCVWAQLKRRKARSSTNRPEKRGAVIFERELIMGKIFINTSQSFHYILIIQTIIRHGTERLWSRITWCISSGLISLVSKSCVSPNLHFPQHRLQNSLLERPGELLSPGYEGWRGALHKAGNVSQREKCELIN